MHSYAGASCGLLVAITITTSCCGRYTTECFRESSDTSARRIHDGSFPPSQPCRGSDARAWRLLSTGALARHPDRLMSGEIVGGGEAGQGYPGAEMTDERDGRPQESRVNARLYRRRAVRLGVPKINLGRRSEGEGANPWPAGVLQGVERLMAFSQRDEEEASRQRAIKRNKEPH